MQHAIDIIRQVAEKTDKVMLFHSASGKDSIALLDLIAPYFSDILCVHMYTTKNIEHIARYIRWAQSHYRNCRFITIPHYATMSYIQNGFLGCRKDEKQKQYILSDIRKVISEKYHYKWCIEGFKKSDSVARSQAINKNGEIVWSSKTVMPLAQYTNKDVLEYIHRNRLIDPETYDMPGRSCSTQVDNVGYLYWLRNNFPDDLYKVVQTYPLAARLLFEYDYSQGALRYA